MSTQFNLRYDPLQDPAGRWAEPVASLLDKASRDIAVTIFHLEGAYAPKIGFTKRNGGHLFTSVSEITTEVPANLAAFLADNPGWTIDYVELVKGAGVVDGLATYQGEYRDDRRFPGCSATVDNMVSDSGGPRQSIIIHAPVELLAEYYAAIRSRKLRPKRWYQPKPTWWLMLLGLR